MGKKIRENLEFRENIYSGKWVGTKLVISDSAFKAKKDFNKSKHFLYPSQ